jgi:hypothetical protein
MVVLLPPLLSCESKKRGWLNTLWF